MKRGFIYFFLFFLPLYVIAQVPTPPAGPPVSTCTDAMGNTVSWQLATGCYINGNPLAGGTSASMDAFVFWNYANYGEGTPSDPGKKMLPASQVGAVWGLAFDDVRKKIYASALLKRHCGFGPNGIGAIYTIDPTVAAPAATLLVDVATFPGVSLGVDSRTPTSGVLDDPNELMGDAFSLSWDMIAFPNVAKRGMGGMTIAPDGSKLYVVNLNERNIVEINISGVGVATFSKEIAINDPGAPNGDYRPWAIKYYDNKLWVGMVASAQTSGDINQLAAYVVTIDPNTGINSAPFTFPLTYRKGAAGGSNGTDVNYWQPWTDTFLTLSLTDPASFWINPQPILSDIEFDTDGSMILGFMDRLGHQGGLTNHKPDYPGTDLISVHSSGDIIRVCNIAGTFQLETDGLCPGEVRPLRRPDFSFNSGQGNMQGPGGGEYYWGDFYIFQPYSQGATENHQEIGFGGLAFLPGSGEIASTALDPTGSAQSGGVIKLNNATGRQSDPLSGSYSGYRLYQTTGLGSGTFAKAAGLGDLVVGCPVAAAMSGDVDLRLAKTVDNSQVALGGTVVFTVKVYNDGTGSATGIVVKDSLPTGITYVSSAPAAVYDPLTHLWTIGTLAAGDSTMLTITATINAVGVSYNVAEVYALNETDVDSSPNNQDFNEDDINRVCVTVPYPICPTEQLNVSIANTYTGIRWFKNGVEIAGQTSNMLVITEGGNYTFVANESTCAVDGCCPIIVLDSVCCAITGVISNIQCNPSTTLYSGIDDYITFTLNPTGTGLGANYSVTAVQAAAPVAVTLLNDSPATGINYGAASTFKLPLGAAGGGNVTLTISDGTTGTCQLQLTLNDPGECPLACPPATCIPITIVRL